MRAGGRHVALWCSLLVLLPAAPDGVRAQTAPVTSRGKETVKERVDRLESEVQELREGSGGRPPEEVLRRLEALEASVKALKAELSELARVTWKEDDADEERDARLDDLAEENARLWREVDALKAAAETARTHPRAGYDNGFFIRSENDTFQFAVNGFIRPAYRLVLQKPGTDETDGAEVPTRLSPVVRNGFGFDNARITVAAKMPAHLSFRLEIDYGTLSGAVQYPPGADVSVQQSVGRVAIDGYALRFQDAYAEYAPFEALVVRLGQFRVPFDEETRFMDNRLTFPSRSLMTRRYLVYGDSPNLDEDAVYAGWGYESARGSSFGRDLGLSLGGGALDGRLSYEVGAFNGGGSNAPNDNRDVLAAFRIFSDPMGPMSPGMSDVAVAGTPMLRVGAGFAFDLLRHEDQLDPGREYNSADYSVTADAHLKWHGASVLVSGFFRHSDHGSAIYDVVSDGSDERVSRDKPLRSLGLTAGLAYFFAASGLEPAIRYGMYDARVHLRDDHVHEVTGALNYYAIARHLTLKLAYRGLFPQDRERSYLAPLGVWYGQCHEISAMAEVSF